MALVNAYCSVQDVRDQLDDSGSKLSAALIEKAVAATSRAIDRHTHRRFWKDPAVVIRVFDVCDPCTALVDDIADMVGLVVKVDNTGTGTYATTWTGTDYQLRPLNADADGGAYSWRQIGALGGKYFPAPFRGYPNLQVTAKWGWSAIPDEVSEAAILKAVSLFRRKDAPFGVAGFAEFGAVRITRRDPDVIDLLSPYVIPVVA